MNGKRDNTYADAAHRVPGKVIDVPLLHQAVEVQARYRPDSIAIDEEERQLTYAELHDAMERLALALCREDICRHDRVVVLADNGIEAYAALLGIMRADACFVPINPANPPARVAEIINEAEAAAVICTAQLLPLLAEAAPLITVATAHRLFVPNADATALKLHKNFATSFSIRVSQNQLAEITGYLPPSCNREEDLAYIIFTSGTTGRPKGVMVSHRAIRSTISWGVEHFDINPGDRLSNHSRLTFDVALFDIFCTFFAGATVCPLVKPSDIMLPYDFIQRMKITVWFSVPAVIAMLVRSRQIASGPFITLRAALFAGEALPPESVAAWREHQCHVPLFNLYGPTEAAIVVTVHNVGVDVPFVPNRPVPIGIETRDSELLILNMDNDNSAAVGETGRLMITGSQLAKGYWRQPELTAAAFRINPLKPEVNTCMYDTGDLAYRDASGHIVFQGRLDSQVKIKGYRVELGEIEAAMGACPGLRESAAIVDPNDPTSMIAVVSRTSDELTEERLFAVMDERLPAYMVPQRIIIMEELPRNENGKVDRSAITLALSADIV